MARCHENGNFDQPWWFLDVLLYPAVPFFKGNLHWIRVARILLGLNVESKA